MENIKDLKINDNILVCDVLETYITKIENEKIYFYNKDGIQQYEEIENIKVLRSLDISKNEIKYIKEDFEEIHFKINCGIYPFDIIMFFSSSKYLLNVMKYKLSEKSFKSFSKLFNNSNHDGRFCLNDDNTMVIHLLNIPKTIDDLGILLHELQHANISVHRILEMDLCHATEESYTYLLQYLQKQVFTELNLKIETNYGKQ